MHAPPTIRARSAGADDDPSLGVRDPWGSFRVMSASIRNRRAERARLADGGRFAKVRRLPRAQ
jgi:hypothetical protein